MCEWHKSGSKWFCKNMQSSRINWQRRRRVEPFSILWTYIIRRANNMLTWSRRIILLLLRAATSNNIMALSNTHHIYALAVNPFILFTPLKGLWKGDVSRMLRTRMFLFHLDPFSKLCTRSCPQCCFSFFLLSKYTKSDGFQGAHLNVRLMEFYLQCWTCKAAVDLLRQTRIVHFGNI